MFEKVNPSHPDKVADRIAGALVDLAYTKQASPKVAIEVLIGHGECFVVGESSVEFTLLEMQSIVSRIAGNLRVRFKIVPQDKQLSLNQRYATRCGDNGIFKGTIVTEEQVELTRIAKEIYAMYPHDGKYIKNGDSLIICQSNASTSELRNKYPTAKINPIGDWTGGSDVDAGATNRKLGSDMGDSVTGGGLHGKDLSKADVTINIYNYLQAQKEGRTVETFCCIGQEDINGVPYSEIVSVAKQYIDELGGFEKFAEWGLIR